MEAKKQLKSLRDMKKVTNIFNIQSTAWITKTAFLLLLCIGFQQNTLAQTCSGDIVLETQADVDAFGPYTAFSGNITITSKFVPAVGYIDPITDLSPLVNLQSVSGNLSIYNTFFTDLNGLSGLSSYLHKERLIILRNTQKKSSFEKQEGGLTYLFENIDGVSYLLKAKLT